MLTGKFFSFLKIEWIADIISQARDKARGDAINYPNQLKAFPNPVSSC